MKTPSMVRGQGGAAAIEFAIIAPLLFMLIFGMLEYGVAFFQVQNLRAAVREGARVAAVRGTSSDVVNAITAASAGSLPSSNGVPAGWSFSPPITPTTCSDATSGSPVTLTLTTLPTAVQGSFKISVPFLPQITLTPTISGSFRCE